MLKDPEKKNVFGLLRDIKDFLSYLREARIQIPDKIGTKLQDQAEESADQLKKDLESGAESFNDAAKTMYSLGFCPGEQKRVRDI
ncbi:MAG: hypothetical protein MUP70_07805 [Candidatus Aminicenantes bacterium]|nr:hypothetical protein [Candidatus Aminicenantes bacterium]